MFKISYLQKLLGRVDKVKLVREILVVLLVPYAIFLYKFFTDLQSLSKISNFNLLMQNTGLFLVIILPFVGLIVAILFIRQIDNWEDSKGNKRHKELLDSIDSLTHEIRLDREARNERNNSNKRDNNL
jgi:hypothetical protein